MKKFRKFLEFISITLMIFSILIVNPVYAKAADYTFRYTDKYLQNKNLSKKIENKTLYVVDEETGKKVKYDIYKKKYEKRYTVYSKLIEPTIPKESKTTESVYTKPSNFIMNHYKNYSDYPGVFYCKMFEEDNNIKITDVNALRSRNTSKLKNVEKLTGIKINEKYLEDYINNVFTYINKKTLSQIHNANNPSRKTIEKLMNYTYIPDKDKKQKYEASLAYSLFYNTKINLNKFNFDKYEYDIPYVKIIDLIRRCHFYDRYDDDSDDIHKIKVISINDIYDGSTETNEEYIKRENEEAIEYFESWKVEEPENYQEWSAEMKKKYNIEEVDFMYGLNGNKPSELIYGNSIGFDCYFYIGNSFCIGSFYLYNNKLVLGDIFMPDTMMQLTVGIK